MFWLKKTNLHKKNFIVEEELDDTGNLVELPKTVFIDEQSGNLKVVVDNWVLTKNISL